MSPCSANNNINILSTNAYFEKHYILEVINQKVPRANRDHIWNHDEWVVPVVLTLSLYICVHIYINGIILYTDHKIACIVFPSAKSSTMIVDAPRTETQLFQLKHAPDHVDPSYLAKHWHPCAQIHSYENLWPPHCRRLIKRSSIFSFLPRLEPVLTSLNTNSLMSKPK